MAGAPVTAPNTAEAPSRTAPMRAADDDGRERQPDRARGRGDQRAGQRAEQADAEVAPHGQLIGEPSGRGGSVVRVSGASVAARSEVAVRERWS